jgi:transposase
MIYCGIDLGGLSSYIHVTDCEGQRLWAGAVNTTKAGLESRLKPFLIEGLAVAIEAGNQTAWVYEWLMGLGANVIVVNPAKVKLIAESRRKTDKIDAKILCELLRVNGLPNPVHMPSAASKALRGLLVARRQLITARSKLCNVVRGLIRQEGVRLPARALSTKIGWKRLFNRGFEHDYIASIVAAYYTSFQTLTQSIAELDQQLAERERSDTRTGRLKTIPRVGRIASLTFLAAVDDVNRFPSSRKLIGYSGLAPTVRQSSERTEYGAISREGRRELPIRNALVTHRRTPDTDHFAGSPLAELVSDLQPLHQSPLADGLQNFFESTSCSIFLSRLRSASSCLSFWFSSSSCFNRRTSATPRPAYLFFQR